MLNAIITEETNKPPLVDMWIDYEMKEEDQFFIPVNGALLMPISKLLGLQEEDPMLDRFFLSMKRAYSKEDKLLLHFSQYLNYFIKFYDKDHQLMSIYTHLKVTIDTMPEYTVDRLEYDIRRLILFSDFADKVHQMNVDNFYNTVATFDNKNKALGFNDEHAMILNEISLFQIIVIPIIAHYAFKHQNTIGVVDNFLLRFFAIIIKEKFPHVDIISKLTETVQAAFEKHYSKNITLWAKQPIQGVNLESAAIACVKTLIISVMPKYTYNKINVHLNQVSIKNTLNYSISDIKYDFELNELDHENRDADNNSELDKFEAHLTKKNESLFLHNRVNYESVMTQIERIYGPFDQKEINYYKAELSKDRPTPINELQKELVFNLFYKYFGDTAAIKSIDLNEYIKLILAAKKLLHSRGLFTMEALVSGKIIKVINRASINKKELIKIQSSNLYGLIVAKYKNPKVIDQCLSLLAKLISSKFQLIDFHNQELTGTSFVVKPDLINQEFLEYLSLI